MDKVAEEGHDQVVHELIRVGAEVDVQNNTYQLSNGDVDENANCA